MDMHDTHHRDNAISGADPIEAGDAARQAAIKTVIAELTRRGVSKCRIRQLMTRLKRPRQTMPLGSAGLKRGPLPPLKPISPPHPE
jgi:hypothetical protein